MSTISVTNYFSSLSQVGKSLTNGDRRLEGVNINKGLSVLGHCIAAICHKEKHVPFRDSILTKVGLYIFGPLR